MAGKCLSATHEAVASTRVIPICMGQGQAAGTAAALAVQRRCAVRAVPIRDIQNLLIDQGAELGQSLAEPDEELIERIGILPVGDADNDGLTDDSTDAKQLEGAWIN